MPDEALLRMTPIGKWCYDASAAILEEDPEGEHQTALQQVLRIVCELNTAFVQDMAAMIALHQDRQNHHLYEHMEMFESAEWKASWKNERSPLEKEDTPLDANLEKVSLVPGVLQRLHLQERLTQDLVNKIRLITWIQRWTTLVPLLLMGFREWTNDLSFCKHHRIDA
jgi:hypothetical protein